MGRPAIGICTLLEDARCQGSTRPAVLVPALYVDAVRNAGAMAILLAPDGALTAAPDELLDRLDGLMLLGGADVGPSSYGARAHPATAPANPERDAFELALARRALARDLPLLGICRGMQIMNVALGGTLHQHLPELVGHDHHRRALGTFAGVDHWVRLASGSLAERAAGRATEVALSVHHQGVDRVGDGLRVTGWAQVDGWPEAIELPANRFALGVQWHPEADPDSRLVAALVDAARAPSGR